MRGTGRRLLPALWRPLRRAIGEGAIREGAIREGAIREGAIREGAIGEGAIRPISQRTGLPAARGFASGAARDRLDLDSTGPSPGGAQSWRFLLGAAGATTAGIAAWKLLGRHEAPAQEGARLARREAPAQAPTEVLPRLSVGDARQFTSIVAGAGTAGCLVAYLLAKWMEELELPGTVLLVDRGGEYVAPDGPHPAMAEWYSNWGAFGEAHETRQENGSAFPIVGSDHRGVGGSGAHDTRISFTPSDAQLARLAVKMGMPKRQLETYLQAALDMMPLSPCTDRKERFFEAVLDALDRRGELARAPGIDVAARILADTVGYCSMAMFPDETRWTSAYLLEDGVRPKNLRVVTEADIDRVVIEQRESGRLTATGVVLRRGDHVELAELDPRGEVAVTAGAIGAPAILQRSGVGPRALEALRIPVLVPNEEVGHGVDHHSIAVNYEWLDRWREGDGEMPRGGAMAWPVVLFATLEKLDRLMMAHFAIDDGVVTGQPNCTQPGLQDGYRVQIASRDSSTPAPLVYARVDGDIPVLVAGLRRMVRIFETLRAEGVVGARVTPPAALDLEDDARAAEYVRENLLSVHHWMSTCKAGIAGEVADQFFRVRAGTDRLVENLRVGSGAALPEIPEANPHVTIAAFSVALADALLAEQLRRRDLPAREPADLAAARETLAASGGQPVIRRPGEERPNMREIARRHRASRA